MRKAKISFVIAAFVLGLGLTFVSDAKAVSGSNSILDIVDGIKTQIDLLVQRVTSLESKSSAPVFYTRDFGPYSANVREATTIDYGCDAGDSAVGGGLYGYQGVLSNWRTVRSVPMDAEYNNGNWETTVINEVESGSFSLRIKCQDLTVN